MTSVPSVSCTLHDFPKICSRQHQDDIADIADTGSKPWRDFFTQRASSLGGSPCTQCCPFRYQQHGGLELITRIKRRRHDVQQLSTRQTL